MLGDVIAVDMWQQSDDDAEAGNDFPAVNWHDDLEDLESLRIA